jgi:type IV pilus secretin PilQ/predicted competence protein
MKVGSMNRGKRILLVTTALLLAANGADAGFWKSRKAQPATASSASASAMTLSAVDLESGRVVLRTSGTPAYTSYSPSPEVFVVDLTGTSRPADLAIPASLPSAVASISAEEAVEMGSRLTRVTFRFNKPFAPQASAADHSVVVTMPEAMVEATAAEVVEIAEVPAPTPEPVVEQIPPAAPEPVQMAPVTPMRKASSVKRISTSGSGETVEVTIAGDGSFEYKAFRLENPSRLVIDLQGVRNRAAKSSLDVNEGLVKRVRVAQFATTPSAITRVVVDLNGKTEYALTPDGDHLRVSFGDHVAAKRSADQVITASNAEPVRVDPPKPEPKVAASVAEISPIADNATWKMPANAPSKGARQVINGPMDQVPPDTTRRTTPATTPATPLSSENVFDDAANAAQSSSINTVAGSRTLSGTARVFTGDPISLNLKDADIKDVLRTFAQLTGLNIAVDPNVNGTVTVDFVDVPWDQALDLILRQNGLTFLLEGNVMRVGTIARLTTEATAATELAERERLNVPLTTLSFKLSYAKATDVSTLLRDIASPRAKIIVDSRTNQLIVSEIPQFLGTMRNLIDTVDVPTRQVQIEARVVETTKSFQLRYGFDWGFGGVLDPALGTGTGLIFPNRIGFEGGPFTFTGGANPIFGVQLFDVLGAFDLDFTLHATEVENLTRVVSAPKVTTQDNIPAEIQSGLQIPYQTRVNFTTTISYIDATLRLSVTPQITEAGTIIMDIAVQKTTPGGAVEGAAGTPLNTRQARTRVMVRDGGTAVIGGIYQVSETDDQSRIPLLHSIPILGALFRSNAKTSNHDELLIFITPRIVRGT